jgi:hypothetical protein
VLHREERVEHGLILDDVGRRAAVAGRADLAEHGLPCRGLRAGREVEIERGRAVTLRERRGHVGGGLRREHPTLERRDQVELGLRRIGIELAVSPERAERLELERRLATVELVRRGVRDVLDRRHAAPHRDRARRVGDDVPGGVDHVDVVGERHRDAHEAGLQVIEGEHRRFGIVGIDPIEQRIARIGREQRLDVLRREHEVIALEMAGRACPLVWGNAPENSCAPTLSSWTACSVLDAVAPEHAIIHSPAPAIATTRFTSDIHPPAPRLPIRQSANNSLR